MLPSQKEFMAPTFKAIHNLGGSGSNQEIYDEVAGIMDLSDEQLDIPAKNAKSQAAKYTQWALLRLKGAGYLVRPSHGLYVLTSKGNDCDDVAPDDVNRQYREQDKHNQERKRARGDFSIGEPNSNDLPSNGNVHQGDDGRLENVLRDVESSQESGSHESSHDTLIDADEAEEIESWRDQLYSLLTKMDPAAFERLCQRLLRQSGFTKVEVTKPSHDGGIDGKGILQVNEFLSFRVVFQCKRYSGSVGPDVVQKLRGAMPGSTDRGLIVTTGNFTQGAKREAMREDKVLIELVDGEKLIDKLAELELGVVPAYSVHPDFFANI